MRQLLPTLLRQAGFTLIELVVCVAIVSALATAAIVSIAPSRARHVDIVADKIVHALRFAQQEAFATGKPTFVGLDTVSKAVEVYRYEGSVKTLLTHPMEKRPYTSLLATSHLRSAEIALQARFVYADGSTAPRVGFDMTGRPGKQSGMFFLTY